MGDPELVVDHYYRIGLGLTQDEVSYKLIHNIARIAIDDLGIDSSEESIVNSVEDELKLVMGWIASEYYGDTNSNLDEIHSQAIEATENSRSLMKLTRAFRDRIGKLHSKFDFERDEALAIYEDKLKKFSESGYKRLGKRSREFGSRLGKWKSKERDVVAARIGIEAIRKNGNVPQLIEEIIGYDDDEIRELIENTEVMLRHRKPVVAARYKLAPPPPYSNYDLINDTGDPDYHNYEHELEYYVMLMEPQMKLSDINTVRKNADSKEGYGLILANMCFRWEASDMSFDEAIAQGLKDMKNPDLYRNIKSVIIKLSLNELNTHRVIKGIVSTEFKEKSYDGAVLYRVTDIVKRKLEEKLKLNVKEDWFNLNDDQLLMKFNQAIGHQISVMDAVGLSLITYHR
jgi:hypothetical protein